MRNKVGLKVNKSYIKPQTFLYFYIYSNNFTISILNTTRRKNSRGKVNRRIERQAYHARRQEELNTSTWIRVNKYQYIVFNWHQKDHLTKIYEERILQQISFYELKQLRHPIRTKPSLTPSWSVISGNFPPERNAKPLFLYNLLALTV